MMWKETYRIGIDLIDEQHIELFRRIEELINALDSPGETAVFADMIHFLKDYVIKHFRDEEAYQQSIQYSDFENHRREHRKFTQTVLEYEEKLIGSNFDPAVLKDLAGVLTAWLIYHVADTDLKIAGGQNVPHAKKTEPQDILLFASGAAEVMEKMAGLTEKEITAIDSSAHTLQSDVFVEIHLVGDRRAKAYFCYSDKLAFRLVQIMTMMEQTERNELVLGALAELTNIAMGSISAELSAQQIICDITTPKIVSEPKDYQTMNGALIETPLGSMEIFAANED